QRSDCSDHPDAAGPVLTIEEAVDVTEARKVARDWSLAGEGGGRSARIASTPRPERPGPGRRGGTPPLPGSPPPPAGDSDGARPVAQTGHGEPSPQLAPRGGGVRCRGRNPGRDPECRRRSVPRPGRARPAAVTPPSGRVAPSRWRRSCRRRCTTPSGDGPPSAES